MAAEPEAVRELLDWCAGLPLALGIVGSRAAAHSTTPLAVWARDLRDAATRLGVLDAVDPQSSVRAPLSWSHATLTPDQVELFGLLGSAPGPDIGVAAACAADRSPEQTGTSLRALTRVSLPHEHVPGRFRMHDLTRLYAVDRPGPVRTPRSTGRSATTFTSPTPRAVARSATQTRRPGATTRLPPRVHRRTGSRRWHGSARSTPIRSRVQRRAVERHRHTEVGQLAWALDTFHWRRGFLQDTSPRTHSPGRGPSTGMPSRPWSTHSVRWTSTVAWPTPVWLARALNSVGWYQARLGRPQEGREPCAQALDLFQRHLDVSGEAAALYTLGLIAHRCADHGDALRLANIANVHAAQGDHDRAHGSWQQALALHRSQGRPDDAARVQRQLDLLRHATNNHSVRSDPKWLGESRGARPE